MTTNTVRKEIKKDLTEIFKSLYSRNAGLCWPMDDVASAYAQVLSGGDKLDDLRDELDVWVYNNSYTAGEHNFRLRGSKSVPSCGVQINLIDREVKIDLGDGYTTHHARIAS